MPLKMDFQTSQEIRNHKDPNIKTSHNSDDCTFSRRCFAAM